MLQKPSKKPSQPKPRPDFQTEQAIRQEKSLTRVVGVDEVGRGALAGPICVVAVEINFEIPEITDSKLLSATQRLYLANSIARNAEQVRFGWATNTEIDTLGLAAAQRLAYQRALENVDAELVLTDNVSLERPHISKVRGDQYFYSVAAASIVAKIVRDSLMHTYHKFFPEYGWGSNVGYGTKAHFDSINRFGPTKLHRHSFLPNR